MVDLKSDLVLAAEIHQADQADTETLVDSVMQAQINLKQAGSEQQIEEVAADKGYHAGHTLELCETVQLRTYITESPFSVLTADYMTSGVTVAAPQLEQTANSTVPLQ